MWAERNPTARSMLGGARGRVLSQPGRTGQLWRVVLVEFRGEDPSVPIKEEHKMTAAQVIEELGRSGFRLVERHEFLPWQHILIFSEIVGSAGAGGAPR